MENEKDRFERYKEKVVNIIYKKLPSCKIYLFGSRARKTNLSGADIDFALDNSKPIDMGIILKFYDDIENTTIPLTVDLVDLNTCSDSFKNEIKREGILCKS